MGQLYIEVSFLNDNEAFINIESLISLFVYKYLNNPNSTEIFLVKQKLLSNKAWLPLNTNNLNHRVVNINESERQISDFKLPVYVSGNSYIAGLCAVCREIILNLESPNDREDLLGFKGSSLLSTAETSVWTNFCETSIIDCTNDILNVDFKGIKEFNLSNVMSQFENHMRQPIRAHNIYKLVQDEKKKQMEKESSEKLLLTNNLSPKENKEPRIKNKKKLKNKKQQTENNHNNIILDHKFAEGYFPTIADLILYPCFKLIFEHLPNKNYLGTLIPLTFKWFEGLEIDKTFLQVFTKLINLEQIKVPENKDISYDLQNTANCSLYKTDVKRYNPRARIFTEQSQVDESLIHINNLKIIISSNNPNSFVEKPFDWNSIPDIAHIEYGDLPEKRLAKKRHQLENMANAIISLAKNQDRIIDFCSGSGHLGIILAAKLPDCHIIFLENKARSLTRAKERIKSLNLKNVSFYQCNVDYFIGNFDIGASLHACGTATDIVLMKCIESKASFVACPCCYGKISPMPHITYPLSEKYKKIVNEKHYMHVAHAADQAHNSFVTECNQEKSKQGEFCMDAIDTDRKLLAEEYGYNVILTKFYPEDCSPKNRLLVGRAL